MVIKALERYKKIIIYILIILIIAMIYLCFNLFFAKYQMSRLIGKDINSLDNEIHIWVKLQPLDYNKYYKANSVFRLYKIGWYSLLYSVSISAFDSNNDGYIDNCKLFIFPFLYLLYDETNKKYVIFSFISDEKNVSLFKLNFDSAMEIIKNNKFDKIYELSEKEFYPNRFYIIEYIEYKKNLGSYILYYNRKSKVK